LLSRAPKLRSTPELVNTLAELLTNLERKN